MLRKWLGPKSTYDQSIPYLYEARLPVVELAEVHHTFQADTICALVEHLNQQGIAPEEVTIFEIYQDQENLISKSLYTTTDNHWIGKPAICSIFEATYPGHIHGGSCSFEDRTKKGRGPF